MDIILTVNTGSSSVRLALFSKDKKELSYISVRHLNSHEKTPEILLNEFLDEYLQKVKVVAHRVVHGGSQLNYPCLINEEIENEIERLSILAPLHNPLALDWIRSCRKVLGNNVPQVAIFDTAFYAHLPEISRIYALPKNLCESHGIRRYGFHGIAHKAMWQRWRLIHPEIPEGGRVISLQLGAGSSITAIDRGKPKDTSMGFSPIEGLVMATRSGDIDPGIITFLGYSSGFTAQEIDQLINKSSGLLGVSGISRDMRELLESNETDAQLAVDLYCYRAQKYIGAYLAVLEGADGILFGGGVGENAPFIRKQILQGMSWFGIELDTQANNSTIGKEGMISPPESKIEIWVIPVDEEFALAKEAIAIFESTLLEDLHPSNRKDHTGH